MHERVEVQLSRARHEEIDRRNEQVRQNKEMLKTVIEAALYLSKHELAFRGKDESNTSLNRGNYREHVECFLSFILILNAAFTESWPKMKDLTWMFLQVFPQKFKNNLSDCINSVIADQVRKDSMDYTFLSTQADESTDASTKQHSKV